MSQSRYISFTGDPAGKPLRYTFHRVADVRAAVLATIGSACGVALLPQEPPPPPKPVPEGATAAPVEPHTPLTLESAATSTAAVNLLDLFLWRFIEGYTMKYRGFDLENKCIDTEPDPSTPPSSPDDLRRAEGMASYYKVFGLIVAGLTGFTEGLLVSLNGGITANTVQRLSRQAVFLTRFYTGYQRHQKVLSGEWRVTNMPTPERLTELEHGRQNTPPQAIPDPSPA